MAAVLDPFILQYAPGPLAELDPAILRARGDVAAFLETMAQLDDSSLAFQWFWDGNDINVRYAFYRALEVLSAAESAARLALAGAPSSEAREAAAATDAARWDTDGLLVSLNDADLDGDPGNAEWTIRQTMAHMINGQRGYAWGSAAWLSVRDKPRAEGPQRLPEEMFNDLPEEDQEARGSLAEVRQELADIIDATSSRYATLTDDEMGVRSGWYGFPVTVGFRQWRWSSHVSEHTVQVEKTLDMLGEGQSEVARLTRLVARAYGRLESVVFYREGASASAGAPILDGVAAELRNIRETVPAAIEAGVPANND
ncbi:MAG TPA: DinB family protein [Candidatus Limnocylindrales bacterium]|nr:DinB family protein [Candidatus Limnocylindrales bacterium]